MKHQETIMIIYRLYMRTFYYSFFRFLGLFWKDNGHVDAWWERDLISLSLSRAADAQRAALDCRQLEVAAQSGAQVLQSDTIISG